MEEPSTPDASHATGTGTLVEVEPISGTLTVALLGLQLTDGVEGGFAWVLG